MPRKRKSVKKPSGSVYELNQAVERVRERNSGGRLRVYEQDRAGKLTRRGDIPVKELVGDDSYLTMVQERFGGGEYIFRVCDGCSRIVGDFSFSIGKPRDVQLAEEGLPGFIKTVADCIRGPVDDTAEARKRRAAETGELAKTVAEVQKPGTDFQMEILAGIYNNMPSRETSPDSQTAEDLQAEEQAQELREQRKTDKLLLGTMICAVALGHFLGKRSSVPGTNPTGTMPSAQPPDQAEPPQTQGEAYSQETGVNGTAGSPDESPLPGGEKPNAAFWSPPIPSWCVEDRSTTPGQLRSLGDLAVHMMGSASPYQLTEPDKQAGDGDASELDAANPDPERGEDVNTVSPQDMAASEPNPVDAELKKAPQETGQTGSVEDTERAK